MDNNAKLFVGPVSKNIVDVIIEEANISNTFIGLIPSRRQVDFLIMVTFTIGEQRILFLTLEIDQTKLL